MTPDQLSAKVETLVSNAETALGAQINKTNQALFEQMQLLLNRLELNTDGTIKQNQYNRSILAKGEEYFNKAFNQSGYYSALDQIPNTIGNLTAANSAYFGTIIEGFTPDTQYIKSLQKQTIGQLESLLANEGLELTMKTPIINVLNQNINSGASLTDLTAQLREFILGSDKLDPTLTRYAKQISRDSLFNYSASLQESISQNAGLQFYQYLGASRKDSREFCAQRANQYFHKTEVEKWASLDWQGKRKGTTSSTIFIYRGGYNCEHSLIPVSELVVPKPVIERSKSLGYYK
jgi:hypothetical protein